MYQWLVLIGHYAYKIIITTYEINLIEHEYQEKIEKNITLDEKCSTTLVLRKLRHVKI